MDPCVLTWQTLQGTVLNENPGFRTTRQCTLLCTSFPLGRRADPGPVLLAFLTKLPLNSTVQGKSYHFKGNVND
jgi:hypothetical protein